MASYALDSSWAVLFIDKGIVEAIVIIELHACGKHQFCAKIKVRT